MKSQCSISTNHKTADGSQLTERRGRSKFPLHQRTTVHRRAGRNLNGLGFRIMLRTRGKYISNFNTMPLPVDGIEKFNILEICSGSSISLPPIVSDICKIFVGSSVLHKITSISTMLMTWKTAITIQVIANGNHWKLFPQNETIWFEYFEHWSRSVWSTQWRIGMWLLVSM